MFDMLSEHEPDNLLLAQAREEVLESEMELGRLRDTLRGLEARSIEIHQTERLTPLAFPLWADRLRGQLSTEDFQQRVERMLAALESPRAQPPQRGHRRSATAP
jgi:ATP-dependent Lhr-like helicase